MSYIGKQPTKAPLTASDIEDGIITAAKIEDGAVVAAEIASNAVTTAKINADAVTSAKIADNAVVTAAINADAITGAKIADDAINSEHYTDGSVDTAHIADLNVTQAKIADQAINEAKMQISNAPTNGYMLTAQSGNTGGLTWAAAPTGFDPDGAVVFNESSADADFRVESNGNDSMIKVDAGNDRVGIGRSSPAGTLDVNGNAMIDSTSTSYGNRLVVGAPNPNQTSAGGYGWGMGTSGSMMWTFHDGNGGYWNNTNSSNSSYINMRTKASTVGSIHIQSSSVSFNTSSDYRIKENVDYTWDATTRLKQLKPARFNFIADDTNTLVDGFLAHEVSSIVPEAISGEKDAVNEDGSIIAQGIDQAKLVPLLVKTIQELEARIKTLEDA